MKMNKFEYEFLTGKWEDVKGAAYNATYDFCQEFGWIMGWSDHDEPIPTAKGIAAMEEYKKSIDVV